MDVCVPSEPSVPSGANADSGPSGCPCCGGVLLFIVLMFSGLGGGLDGLDGGLGRLGADCWEKG